MVIYALMEMDLPFWAQVPVVTPVAWVLDVESRAIVTGTFSSSLKQGLVALIPSTVPRRTELIARTLRLQAA